MFWVIYHPKILSGLAANKPNQDHKLVFWFYFKLVFEYEKALFSYIFIANCSVNVHNNLIYTIPY